MRMEHQMYIIILLIVVVSLFYLYPGGRLPITWYQNDYVKNFPMTSMQMRPIPTLGYPGRTYKFYDGAVVYPFGYGLSYTKFRYTYNFLQHAKNHKQQSSLPVKIKLGPRVLCRDIFYTNNTQKPQCPSVSLNDVACRESFAFEVTIENVGGKDGSEVVMVYSKPPAGIEGTHLKKLIGFQRVFVPAGGAQKVLFTFNACKDLGIVDYKSAQLLPLGTHSIVVGDGVINFPVQVSIA